MEQTFVMIKPEGVKRRLIGEIIKRFEQKGLYLAAVKIMKADKALLEKHYEELKGKPFFNGLVEWMSSGNVVPMVFEGENAVKVARKLMGVTNPMDAEVGTIRADFSGSVGRNIVHGSDSVENAKKEISLWFGEVSAAEAFENNQLYE